MDVRADYKGNCWKIDAFELSCWRRLLRVPWTERRANQSILEEINPECLLEGLVLKFQYFGHLMWRPDSLEKTLMLAKIKSNRRSRQQRMRWLDSITDSIAMNWSKFQGTVEDRGAWSAAVHGVIESRIWLSDRTTTSYPFRRADIRGREVTSWFPKIFTISCTVDRGKDKSEIWQCLSPGGDWVKAGWSLLRATEERIHLFI